MKSVLFVIGSLLLNTYALAIPQIGVIGGTVTIPTPYIPKSHNTCSAVTVWASSHCKSTLELCESAAAGYRTLNSDALTVSTQCVSAFGTGQCNNVGLILQTSVQARP